MTDALNRRRLLAGTAMALSAPVVALPALATADPIFALIEKHKEAYELHGLACDRESDAAEKALASGISLSKEYPGKHETQAALSAASDAAHDALWDLATTAPTTLAGAVALARYVGDFCGQDRLDGEPAITALETLADALLALAGGEVAHV